MSTDPETGSSALAVAAASRNDSAVSVLLAANAATTHLSSDGVDALGAACEVGAAGRGGRSNAMSR